MSYILLDYKVDKFQALNNEDITFVLTIKKGFLFKRIKKITYSIPSHESLKKYTNFWDRLIKTKKKCYK